jgi:putative N6-adenine-specific DNA methylase
LRHAPPGLEPFVLQELVDLGLRSSTYQSSALIGQGGVAFRADLTSLYQVNLYLRTATRVLLRLEDFHASKFEVLRRKAAGLPWEHYIKPGQALNLNVTCHKSRLYHSGAVAQRIAEAIGDRLGSIPRLLKSTSEDDSAQKVIIRLVNDQCTVSVDSSGDALYKRGYRQALAKAPLRESLAAAMLSASGWDKRSPLIDPFCGSGVIPIEAALLASEIPPGLQRRFAFMDWPNFSPDAWKTRLVAAQKKIQQPENIIYGSDRDIGAVRMAAENAARAGVADWVTFKTHAISNLEPPSDQGWLVTNPPYGVRVSQNRDLRDLYASFGALLNNKFSSWRVAFLCTDDKLATLTQLKFEKGISLDNGGIPVKLNLGRVA